MVSNEEAIERLQRRYNHLDQRIHEAEANGKELTYDKAERTAIGKAINSLKEGLDDGGVKETQ